LNFKTEYWTTVTKYTNNFGKYTNNFESMRNANFENTNGSIYTPVRCLNTE
jgi:hypothetical protein